MMLVSGCANTGTSNAIVPPPFYPDDETDKKLTECCGEFYLKFLNQQFDLEDALDEEK